MSELKANFKPKECKYCGANDLVWIPEPNGRWLLTESYGLPHGCKEKSEFFRKQREEQNKPLKAEYEAAKARLAAIPDGTRCTQCPTVGAMISRWCMSCDGKRVFNEKTKKYILYRLRTRLWPGMKSKKSPQ